jgi:hypothetical protein
MALMGLLVVNVGMGGYVIMGYNAQPIELGIRILIGSLWLSQ